MKILLFGGTFDPPHNGHMALLRHMLDAVSPDLALVMPAGIPPHKKGYGTKGALRLAMCRDFLSAAPCVQISSHELENEGKSYTIDTLIWLAAEYPKAELYLSMGSDMLLGFTQWKDWQQILKLAVIVCQSRDDAETASMAPAIKKLEAAGGTVQLVCAPVLRLSSSELREKRAAGQDVTPLVPQSAALVIDAYNLYTDQETDLPDLHFCRKLAKTKMSEYRYIHTKNVASLAKVLALRFGANEKKAEIAGLLHDICKELPKDKMLQMLHENAIITGNAAEKPIGIWHAAAAMVYLKNELGVQDEELLLAVRWHTSGHAGMTKLEKIIYMADMCSDERDYPEVGELRDLLDKNLDEALTKALAYSIRWLQEEKRDIDPDSRAALQFMQGTQS